MVVGDRRATNQVKVMEMEDMQENCDSSSMKLNGGILPRKLKSTTGPNGHSRAIGSSTTQNQRQMRK